MHTDGSGEGAPVKVRQRNAADKGRARPTDVVPTEVRRIIFSQIEPEQGTSAPSVGNMRMLLDIPLEVRVELGRTQRLLREILAIGPGSVIELDRLAGEPVDVLVNGKIVARGEVVVVDENFGVKISEIISSVETLSSELGEEVRDNETGGL
ncbi:MAG TPA: flagellar motor switch protein FliN [Clostridia bacterium]|nr:flagellar motor switch protein FliN [Clostridia bacterium]